MRTLRRNSRRVHICCRVNAQNSVNFFYGYPAKRPQVIAAIATPFKADALAEAIWAARLASCCSIG